MTQQSSRGLQRFYWVLGGVAVLGILLVGYQVISQARNAAAAEPVEVEGLDDPARLTELAQGMVLGDPDAPITIFEFGDFQCPACGHFAMQTKPLVETAYINDGTAKFVFYDFPLTNQHPNAFLAARASRCAADQDGYWEYHNKLFEEQQVWSLLATPVGTFSGYAAELGLDQGDFESCLNSDRHAEVVSAQIQLGIGLGVPSTPTIMVSKGDGSATRLADRRFPTIQQAVDALLTPSGAR